MDWTIIFSILHVTEAAAILWLLWVGMELQRQLGKLPAPQHRRGKVDRGQTGQLEARLDGTDRRLRDMESAALQRATQAEIELKEVLRRMESLETKLKDAPAQPGMSSFEARETGSGAFGASTQSGPPPRPTPGAVGSGESPGSSKTDSIPAAWREYFLSDGGRSKGKLEKLRETLNASLGDSFVSLTEHPNTTGLAILRLRERGQREVGYALPLWHDYTAHVEAFYLFEGGDQFTRIGGLVRPAQVDPSGGTLISKGTVTK